MLANHSNWSGHVHFSAARIHHPQTVDQIQALVRNSNKLKVVGAGHSFNRIADSTEDHIVLDQLDAPLVIDHEKHTATFNAGLTYGELCAQLHGAGYAIHNMASLPHVTVIGACATATHGSGDANGCLATAVAALELVTADGEVAVLSRDRHREHFEGAVVGLGGLGVVTKLTLDLMPGFTMQQEVYENLPSAQLYDHFDAIAASAYSVSLFTDWRPDRVNQVWLKRRLLDDAGSAPAASFFGTTLATVNLHPLASLAADPCTPQLGVPGPWHERLPHFRVDHTPASGEELQTEYFVPRQYAVAAFRAMAGLYEDLAPVLLISEVRTVAADSFWMSPFYQRPGVGIHFSWKKDWSAVQKLLPRIEALIAPFQARPHWGKLFTIPREQLQTLYPRLADFQTLLRTYDPQGKFRNAFLDEHVL